MTAESIIDRRRTICAGCDHRVSALQDGACDLIRDGSERVSPIRYTVEVLLSGHCYAGHFEELHKDIAKELQR